ncbi:phosphoethanolamine transferase CptA [Komagataeibacter europaeus]|uniref:Phosphoethanolamine transferase CptA n=2 Tax=Komagataeibacter europaeus TaxID=33995 RepID=A0A0M0EF93_KOMEU|nr:phosphoethanolamine transferase CptA [Komagataeibacter europaeus]
MLQAIAGTNSHEALSTLESFSIPVVMLLVASFAAQCYLSWKFSRFRLYVFIFTGLTLVYPYGRAIVKAYHVQKERHVYTESASSFRAYAPGTIGNTVYLLSLIMNDENTEAVPHQNTDSMITDKVPGRVKNIIVVVGESDLADRHTIYGYKAQNTTPNIQRLVDGDRICVIQNAHSSANMTRYAVPMLFSFYDPDHRDKLYSEKNIIELAKDNKYKTFWISSQDGFGQYSRSFGYLSEFSDYVTRQDYNNKENHVDWHDESLLPVIKEKFADPDEYKFFVIHIIGSHIFYSDDRTQEDIDALPTADTYDQSIHRTDRILNQIINMADAELKDYALLYTSDHAEIINVGHGLQYGGYAQYRVPVFMLDKSKKYCQMAEEMRNNDGYYTEVMNKFILLDMMGYTVNPDSISDVRIHDHVLHSDSMTYDYKNLPTEKDRK